MTPTELAAKLVGPEDAPKLAKAFVRPLLRKAYPRQAEAKGTNWQLDDEQAKLVTDAYKARTKAKA